MQLLVAPEQVRTLHAQRQPWTKSPCLSSIPVPKLGTLLKACQACVLMHTGHVCDMGRCHLISALGMLLHTHLLGSCMPLPTNKAARKEYMLLCADCRDLALMPMLSRVSAALCTHAHADLTKPTAQDPAQYAEPLARHTVAPWFHPSDHAGAGVTPAKWGTGAGLHTQYRRVRRDRWERMQKMACSTCTQPKRQAVNPSVQLLSQQ